MSLDVRGAECLDCQRIYDKSEMLPVWDEWRCTGCEEKRYDALFAEADEDPSRCPACRHPWHTGGCKHQNEQGYCECGIDEEDDSWIEEHVDTEPELAVAR